MCCLVAAAARSGLPPTVCVATVAASRKMRRPFLTSACSRLLRRLVEWVDVMMVQVGPAPRGDPLEASVGKCVGNESQC